MIEAIQAAQKRNNELFEAPVQKAADESQKISKEELEARIAEHQKAAEINAFQQRYNKLIQRINNPKQRSQLDILEYQAYRQRQMEAIRLAQEQASKTAETAPNEKKE